MVERGQILVHQKPLSRQATAGHTKRADCGSVAPQGDNSMKANPKVTEFQRDCFANYLEDIRKSVSQFPGPYVYPDGNPVRPVVPVQTTLDKIMLVGAFPSARFERRQGKLIPVGDNLAPFGPEEYFDGAQVRVQESTDALHRTYFPQLGIKRSDLWITDIVRVYLFPEKHLVNCRQLFPERRFVNTHDLFLEIAIAGRGWFLREVEVCRPKVIITLGEVAARVVCNKKTTLDGEIHSWSEDSRTMVVHLAHPEIRRLNKKWDEKTAAQLSKLAKQLPKYL